MARGSSTTIKVLGCETREDAYETCKRWAKTNNFKWTFMGIIYTPIMVFYTINKDLPVPVFHAGLYTRKFLNNKFSKDNEHRKQERIH